MTATLPDTISPLSHTVDREVVASRTERVRAWMAEADVDAVVAYGAPASLGSRTGSAGYLRYLTGWMTTGLPAVLVLPREGRPQVVTMGPHDTRAFDQRAGWYADVLKAGSIPNYPKATVQALRQLVPSGRIGIVGFGEVPGPVLASLTDLLAGYELVEAEPSLDRLRLVRHPQEVEMHRLGARISDRMIATAMEHAVLPGMTGAQLMADVEHAGRSAGAGTPTTWLATGEKPVTTYMEQMEVDVPIGPADRIQLGTSLTYQGYFAQGLRIGVRGKPSARLVEYADILSDIQDAALAAMVPGAKLHHVSDAIETAIDRFCPYTKDSDPFRFQSCHGLGLSYVEPGMARDLNARRDRTLDPSGVEIVAGMVIEVHPNFTVPDLGHVCAGDMAVVTATGAEWLTEYPRGLVQL